MVELPNSLSSAHVGYYPPITPAVVIEVFLKPNTPLSQQADTKEGSQELHEIRFRSK